MVKLDNKISRMACDLNAGTKKSTVCFVYIVIGCVGVVLDSDVHNVYVWIFVKFRAGKH